MDVRSKKFRFQISNCHKTVAKLSLFCSQLEHRGGYKNRYLNFQTAFFEKFVIWSLS